MMVDLVKVFTYMFTANIKCWHRVGGRVGDGGW